MAQTVSNLTDIYGTGNKLPAGEKTPKPLSRQQVREADNLGKAKASATVASLMPGLAVTTQWQSSRAYVDEVAFTKYAGTAKILSDGFKMAERLGNSALMEENYTKWAEFTKNGPPKSPPTKR